MQWKNLVNARLDQFVKTCRITTSLLNENLIIFWISHILLLIFLLSCQSSIKQTIVQLYVAFLKNSFVFVMLQVENNLIESAVYLVNVVVLSLWVRPVIYLMNHIRQCTKFTETMNRLHQILETLWKTTPFTA